MQIDPELMFECLLYLNAFYYPMFAPSDLIMVVAKYKSEYRDTPNIERDGVVCFARLFAEASKLLIFYKWRLKHRKLVTIIAIFMTCVTYTTILYTFILQDPVLKLENVLCSISIMLTSSELFFGFLYFLPCFTKQEY